MFQTEMKMRPGGATGVSDGANDGVGLDLLTDRDLHLG
jgi:hypothetical protein